MTYARRRITISDDAHDALEQSYHLWVTGDCFATPPRKQTSFTEWVSDHLAELDRLKKSNAELLTALEYMVATFNSQDIDPVAAFATIERAKGAIEKAKPEGTNE